MTVTLEASIPHLALSLFSLWWSWEYMHSFSHMKKCEVKKKITIWMAKELCKLQLHPGPVSDWPQRVIHQLLSAVQISQCLIPFPGLQNEVRFNCVRLIFPTSCVFPPSHESETFNLFGPQFYHMKMQIKISGLLNLHLKAKMGCIYKGDFKKKVLYK